MDQPTLEGIIKQIRKEFYALRNGMIADTLRKGGLEHKYIFGLQLPQLKSIAESFRPESEEVSAELARSLWRDRECREARLLACHLMPHSLMSPEEASAWASEVTTREEADILAFRLLRYLPFAPKTAETMTESDSALGKYTAEAILRFI